MYNLTQEFIYDLWSYWNHGKIHGNYPNVNLYIRQKDLRLISILNLILFLNPEVTKDNGYVIVSAAMANTTALLPRAFIIM